MNILDYIGEATEYDKKVALEVKKPKSWLKSVSAFANGVGGVLLFGISNEGELIGLDNAEKDSETISEQIKQKMDPIPQTILDIHKENEKTFYCFESYCRARNALLLRCRRESDSLYKNRERKRSC